MDIDARAFGQLEGEVKALAATLAEQNKTLASQDIKFDARFKELSEQMSTISTTLSEAKGGWRTLVWLAGISATAAGGVTWALQHLIFRPGP